METAPLTALRDLAAGRGVKRGRHDLRLQGEDQTPLFIEALRLEGFVTARDEEPEDSPGRETGPAVGGPTTS